MSTPLTEDVRQPAARGIHLYDIVDGEFLQQMLDEGFVREQSHPSLPHMRILNYAEKAQYSRTWNYVTTACRGLIYDATDGTVLARPWAKFFNYGEHPEGTLDLDALVEVTDKMDGSLGILYFVDGSPAIATRGSFASEQAQHATDLYLRRYHGNWSVDTSLTYLFEIVYPENRIVLDYGELDDLVLLGAVETNTGYTLGPNDLPEWPGYKTAVFQYRSLRAALEAQPRPNAEGLVVRFVRTHTLVKLKQEDYVLLHRIVTGLNERAVWERLKTESLDEICEFIPDEFHAWVEEVAQRLDGEYFAILNDARTDFNRVLLEVEENDRKAFAMKAKDTAHPKLLFMLYDGKDPRELIWKMIRPEAGNFARPAAADEELAA